MVFIFALTAAFLGFFCGLVYLLHHYGWKGINLCAFSILLLVAMPGIVAIGTKTFGRKLCAEKQVVGFRKLAIYAAVFKACLIVLPVSLNDALNEISPVVKRKKAKSRITFIGAVRVFGASVSVAAEEYAMAT